MRRMKAFALALSGSTLLVAGAAHAQGIPVHDVGSILQQIEQVRQGVQVIQNGADQLRQAQELYRDLNKMTDIGNVAQQLRNDVLRTSNVSSSNL